MVEMRMRRGQSTVEWMLIVSMLVVGLAAAGYAFIPDFRKGIDELGGRIDNLYAQGETDGSGDHR